MIIEFMVRAKPPETLPLVTGEALWQMRDMGRAELVEGRIVAMAPTGFWHGYIENKFGVVLEAFVRQHNLGLVSVGEVGIYTGRNPDTIRAADVVFISHQRLAQVKSDGYLDVAPELIVEVMSPSDSWSEVMNKLEEYFSLGVVAVWVADPKKRQIYAYRSLTEVQRFTADDSLSGGELLPGFSVPVIELLGG